jgi:hypothetical protein
MSFLALSQAPPEFDEEIATYTPLIMIPARRPLTPLGPNSHPTIIGERITRIPGLIILMREALVDIWMHFS